MKPDPSHAKLNYRPEIDGLRALAVLPVLLFHAGFEMFSGGFVGVDVFFVISGYLITSIVTNDLQEGKFSVARFYERRARRILPALFLVIAACIPFAWVWMLPAEMQAFSRSVIAAIAFVPNVYFWLRTGYFGTVAEKIPLLHTWSLGVEEQFYVLFPLLLWWIWRFGLRIVGLLIVILALMSFGLSEWAWRTGKFSASFFLAPTRAWELMLGALLAIAWRRRPIHERFSNLTNDLASFLGICMLMAAVLLFDQATPTPSIYALLPTVGTALIIACAGPQTLVHKVLSYRFLVGIGLVSYSAYLWHQPMFAFARIQAGQQPSTVLMLMLIFVSLTLAYLTWRFVETPFRHSRSVSLTALLKSSAIICIALLSFGFTMERSKGFQSRIPIEDRELAKYADTETTGAYVASRFRRLQSDFSENGSVAKVLIIGDSYAEDMVNAIFESKSLDGFEIRTYRFPYDCQIYVGSSDVSNNIQLASRSNCARVRSSPELRRRLAHANVVILAGSWRNWAVDLLPETIKNLALKPNQKLFVVGPKRTGEVNIRRLLQIPRSQRFRYREPVSIELIEMEEKLLHTLPKGMYVSMQSAICGGREDCELFTPDGELISFDGTHLTKAGAAFVGQKLFAMSPLFELRSESR